jgi:hypothetical protein
MRYKAKTRSSSTTNGKEYIIREVETEGGVTTLSSIGKWTTVMVSA